MEAVGHSIEWRAGAAAAACNAAASHTSRRHQDDDDDDDHHRHGRGLGGHELAAVGDLDRLGGLADL